MWDGLFMLFALSTIMAIASFLAGVIPLSFTLSPRQLRTVSLLGAGVLVGASLIVIIPEGVETMYSAAIKVHAHDVPNPQPKIPSMQVHTHQKEVTPQADFIPSERSSALDDAAKIVVRRTTDEVPPDSYKQRASDKKEKEEKSSADDSHPQPQKGGDDDSTEGHREGHTRVHGPEEEEQAPPPATDVEGPSGHIGVAMILGFILMFIVDRLPEAIAPAKPQYQSLHISLSNLHRGPHNSSAVSLNTLNPTSPPPEPLTPLPPHHKSTPPSSATTIGLVIHSCADGIALGASSAAPSSSLSLVIFLAIMIHKAPAAFGLTSVLLKQGLSKRKIRTHLAFFSLAAPAGAVLTWAIVHLLGRARLGGDEGLAWTTGWVLLFSSGTFLYVAMHSMNEVTSNSDETVINGYVDHHSNHNGLSKADITTVLMGMLLPLLTRVGHGHAHAH